MLGEIYGKSVGKINDEDNSFPFERFDGAKCEEREEEGIRNDNDKVVRGV